MASRTDDYELRNYGHNHNDGHPPEYSTYPPDKTPMSRSSLKLALYFDLPALLCTSVLGLALRAVAPKKDDSVMRQGRWLDEEGVSLAQWPKSLFPSQDELPYAAGSFAIATVVLVLVVRFLVFRNTSWVTSRGVRIGLLAFLTLNAVITLVATIYTFALNSRTAVFNLLYAVDTIEKNDLTLFIYDWGTFNRESWSCSVRNLPGFDADLGGAMARSCGMEMATRWLMLVTFLLSAALCTVLHLDSKRQMHFMRASRDARPGPRTYY